MSPVKTFKVFGEPVEVLVSGEMTNGRSTTLTQVSPSGGGPPPHSHRNEDETFYVLKGTMTLEVGEPGAVRTEVMDEGASFHCTPRTVHRMIATSTAVDVIEVSTPELDDVVRLEDAYGRKS